MQGMCIASTPFSTPTLSSTTALSTTTPTDTPTIATPTVPTGIDQNQVAVVLRGLTDATVSLRQFILS